MRLPPLFLIYACLSDRSVHRSIGMCRLRPLLRTGNRNQATGFASSRNILKIQSEEEDCFRVSRNLIAPGRVRDRGPHFSRGAKLEQPSGVVKMKSRNATIRMVLLGLCQRIDRRTGCSGDVLLSDGTKTDMLVNRRVAERTQCRRVAKIQFGISSLPRDCTITDISRGGVKVVAEYPEIPTIFTITLSTGDTRQCRLAWRIGCEFGAEFID
jgi:hypothetical protein